MFSFIKRHKIISALALANIAVVIVVIAVTIVHHAKTATIDIKVAPASAEITLNGKAYENLRQHDIFPGDYQVEIKMDNMESKSFDLHLDQNGFAQIHIYLKDASGGGGYTYYLSHPEDEYLLAEDAPLNDQPAQEFIKNFTKKIGLRDQLPINYDAYTEDFSDYYEYSIYEEPTDNCEHILCLIIEDNTGNSESLAKNKIQKLGYNLSDYRITYQYSPLYGSEVNHE